MNANRAAELLQIEKECIQRQDTPKCCRYTEGCAKCDLVQDSNDLLEELKDSWELNQHDEEVKEETPISKEDVEETLAIEEVVVEPVKEVEAPKEEKPKAKKPATKKEDK